jgi:hypothetical protein
LNVTGLFFGFVYLGAVVLTVLLPRRWIFIKVLV